MGDSTVIERELAQVRWFLERPAKLPKRDAVLAKTAVGRASDVLVQWGHKPTATRNGKWEQMTKILANTEESVFEHIRAFKKLKPAISKRPQRTPVREPGAD